VIRDGYVVWHDGVQNTIAPGADLVIEGSAVLDLVAEYEGQADVEIDARGKLVSPGFIDTHVHVGTRATHRLIVDSGRKDYWAQPFWHWTLARPGTHAPGDVRYESAADDSRSPDTLAALFTAAELLRNGTTTFFEVGSRVSLQSALSEAVAQIGTRAYLGAGYQSSHFVGTATGQYAREPLPDGGRAEMDAAIEFVRSCTGRASGRIRGALVPRETEVCSMDMLAETAKLMAELDVPVQIHAAYCPQEWFHVVQDYGCTPVELLERGGLLGPRVLVGHGQLVAENPLSNWAGGRDLDILAQTQTTVAHSPTNLMRRGRFLDSFGRYRDAGINLSLGTDTFPRDLVSQMRMASYCSKMATGDFTSASAAQVFEAATLAGAQALGRPDLGRLAKGSRADVAIISLRPDKSMRYGVIRDPVQALVDCGIGDDVETVLVDGNICLQDGEIPGINLEDLLDQAQTYAERYWDNVETWDPQGRDADQQCPPAFPTVTTGTAGETVSR
jgi:5-methylthioadenosine/S-adenosylhomocysteine deaminase